MIRVLTLSLRSSSSLPSRIRVPFAGNFSSGAGHDAGESGPRLFVVQPRLRPESALRAKLDEAVCLASSLEEQRDEFSGEVAEKYVPEHIIVQNPAARGHRARADKFFGPGTVDTIKIHLNHVESKGEVDSIFVNTTLSGVQQRNLERTWGKPVLDRISLIIEIFNAHANTREGKLQAELACLMYKKTRLVRVRDSDGRNTFGAEGDVEVVSARGRGSGGRGFIGGAGETEINLQRRRISDRRKLLLSQIEEVRRTRALQRASRKRHGGSDGRGLATVAIVGYTNAGKSTLVSALSDSPLYSDSRLFATVDPRLRNVVLPSGKKVLLSDTVGFISDLPVQLVEAFHATLEEVVEADLLVHVLDSTAPNLDEHRSTVLSVLEQIGVTKEKLENMIEVWNKIDRQEPQDKILDDGEASNISGEDEQDHDHPDKDLDLVEDDDQDHDHHDDNIDDLDLNDDSEQDNDCSDEVFDSENDQDNCMDDTWERSDDKTSVLTSSPEVKTSELTSGPDVKTSALTSVGLQELLELIDGRLREQDEKFKSENVVERNVFGRKWRPNREDETDVAV